MLRRKPLKRKRLKSYGSPFIRKKFTRKKDYVKSLQSKGEELWKKAGKKLHGNYCEVKKNFPFLRLNHTSIIQGDHCISRKNKYFFLDIRNHSSVCASCNKAKSMGIKSVKRAIDAIVKRRHPQWYKEAVWIDMSHESNPSWGDPVWLEEKIRDLQEFNDI